MLHALARPHPWWIALLLWSAAMFTASSFAIAAPAAPAFEIPHLDKVFHFCWFTAGGFILGNAILLRRPPVASIWLKIALPIVLMSIFGALDEYRQSFTPGRSGNDLGDWIADTLGGICGVMIANTMHRSKLAHRFIEWISSNR